MKFCLKQLLPFFVSMLIMTCFAWYIDTGNSSTLFINFHNKVGSKNLVLFDETYTNQFNEPFTVNKFRYYISNIVLIDGDNKKVALKNLYHLVDEEDSSSKQLQLNSSGLKKITAIEFLIGVDSLRNISGVQTDDLDPMKGMFWTWNSGYIFAKLEGKSDSSHAPSHYFSWHVGGYKPKENALRTVTLYIPSSNDKIQYIDINVDVLKWFQSASNNKIAQMPVCHQSGDIAIKLANNYADMFSIAAVK